MSHADSLFAEHRFLESALYFDSASQVPPPKSMTFHTPMAIAFSALSYYRAEELQKADSLFNQALRDSAMWRGQDTILMSIHLEYAGLKAKLGDPYASAEQFTTARLLSDRILNLNDSVRFSIRFSECAALQEVGRFSEAKGLCRSLYADAANDFGKTHERTLLTLEAYFICVIALKEFPEAERLIGGAILALTDAGLQDNQFQPRFTELLALVRYRQGKIPEALNAYKLAFEESNRILGSESRFTQSIRSNYASLLREVGIPSLADSIEGSR